jgi:Glycosyl hydrolase family 26
MSASRSTAISPHRVRRPAVHVLWLAAIVLAASAVLPRSAGTASVLRRASGSSRGAHAIIPKRAHASSATRSRRLDGLVGGSKADCAYSANSVTVLASLQTLVNRRFDCVLVYNNASPDWAGWEKPWFLTDGDPAHSWAAWATAPGSHRQLIITNNLFPSQVNNSDWLHAGAAGAYAGHARALARNLVAAGLGNSVIRLAHEANEGSYPYAIGTTGQELSLWRQFWRRTALAMRSVPGAHFLFDWCINAHWRPIPLNQWYPGDDVVDIVGIDTYDGGVPAGMDRWSHIYTQTDGIRDVLQFAAAHGKPVSIPEWGLWPPGASTLGGGDDPAYVDGIAGVVRNNRVAYQSYFYNLASRSLLDRSPRSLAAYRQHFGGGGDSTGAPTVTAS